MSKNLYLHKLLSNRYLCVVWDNVFKHVHRLHIESDEKETISYYNVYLGQVSKIAESINGYFVNFKEDSGLLPTQQKLSIGDYVLVQVKKKSSGYKKCLLSENILLRGNLVVLITNKPNGKVKKSLKIKAVPSSILQYLYKVKLPYSIILRKTGLKIPVIEVIREARFLQLLWESCLLSKEKRISKGKTGLILKIPNNPLMEFIAQESQEVNQVFVNSKTNENLVKMIGRVKLSKYLTIPNNLISHLSSLLSNFVKINNQGSMIVDKTEGGWFIDINTGVSKEKIDSRDNFLVTNMDSIKFIYERMVSQNISGIIIIDFVSMNNEWDIIKVEDSLRKFMLRDFSFSKLDPIQEHCTCLLFRQAKSNYNFLIDDVKAVLTLLKLERLMYQRQSAIIDCPTVREVNLVLEKVLCKKTLLNLRFSNVKVNLTIENEGNKLNEIKVKGESLTR